MVYEMLEQEKRTDFLALLKLVSRVLYLGSVIIVFIIMQQNSLTYLAVCDIASSFVTVIYPMLSYFQIINKTQ